MEKIKKVLLLILIVAIAYYLSKHSTKIDRKSKTINDRVAPGNVTRTIDDPRVGLSQDSRR